MPGIRAEPDLTTGLSPPLSSSRRRRCRIRAPTLRGPAAGKFAAYGVALILSSQKVLNSINYSGECHVHKSIESDYIKLFFVVVGSGMSYAGKC
jgi:hypothetical protein